jgi:hypothetical protein
MKMHALPAEFKTPSKSDQHASYCGSMVDLVAYAKKKHVQGGMSTTQVRNWIKKHDMVPLWLKDVQWSVDHIVSDKLGGHPWPHNYFLSKSLPPHAHTHRTGPQVRLPRTDETDTTARDRCCPRSAQITQLGVW